jgi:hypothetical protein
MIELVVTFCLIAEPVRCHDRTLVTVVEENVTPMQLMMRAQPEIAKWIETHPGYFTQKWSARRANLSAKA